MLQDGGMRRWLRGVPLTPCWRARWVVRPLNQWLRTADRFYWQLCGGGGGNVLGFASCRPPDGRRLCVVGRRSCIDHRCGARVAGWLAGGRAWRRRSRRGLSRRADYCRLQADLSSCECESTDRHYPQTLQTTWWVFRSACVSNSASVLLCPVVRNWRRSSVNFGEQEFCPKIYVWKINKIPYNFIWYLPKKYFPEYLGRGKCSPPLPLSPTPMFLDFVKT